MTTNTVRYGIRYLVAIAIGLIGASALVLAQGESVGAFLSTIGVSSFGSGDALLNLVRWSTPLVLSGLAFIVAGRAGVFNIGVEGQIIVGSLCAALVGSYVDLPALLLVPLAALSGAAGGLACAWPAAWLLKRFQVNEIVTTLMINYIAVLGCNVLVRQFFQARSADGSPSQTIITAPVLDAAVIPKFTSASDANWTTVVVLLMAVVAAFVLLLTTWGYQVTATGDSPRFAAFAGIDVPTVRYRAFLVSGAVAGLIGAFEVQGVLHSYIDGGLTNYGYNGILVGLVGMSNPLGIVGSGVFLGVLQNSQLGISQFTQISPDMVTLIAGVFILIFAVDPLRSLISKIGRRYAA